MKVDFLFIQIVQCVQIEQNVSAKERKRRERVEYFCLSKFSFENTLSFVCIIVVVSVSPKIIFIYSRCSLDDSICTEVEWHFAKGVAKTEKYFFSFFSRYVVHMKSGPELREKSIVCAAL